MDVRCDRCNTEYEFEDDKITDAGVTVKCTSCGHVFKVKKRPGIVPASALRADPQPADGNEAAKREWRVRKANGDIFTFKELTTLQKWIVERKVAREDEISLTGESWKRLGNIAELSSFFQVVEVADRALAQQAAGAPPAQPQFPTAFTPPGGAYVYPPQGMPGYGTTPAMPLTPQTMPGPVFTPQPMPAFVPGGMPQGPTGGFNPGPAMQRGPMPRTWTPNDEVPLEQVLKAAGLRRSAWKWVFLLAVAGGGAGGWYYYTRYWRPVHGPLFPSIEATTAAPNPPESKPAIQPPPPVATPTPATPVAVEAKPPVPVPEPAKPPEPPKPEAAKPAEASKPAEKPVEAKPEKAVKAVEPGKKGEVAEKGVPAAKDYDWYIRRGDQLRERGKSAQALEMYGKAVDLQPDSVEALAGRGLCYVDMEQFGTAIASLEQALKVQDRYGPAIMGLAEAHRQQGDKVNALKYYQQYLDVLPDGPEADVARTNIDRLKE
jgi:predicted Zn finger-like uncharacterized protein